MNQRPFEVTVDLKLVIHAKTTADAELRARIIVQDARFSGASVIFGVISVLELSEKAIVSDSADIDHG